MGWKNDKGFLQLHIMSYTENQNPYYTYKLNCFDCYVSIGDEIPIHRFSEILSKDFLKLSRKLILAALCGVRMHGEHLYI